MRRWFIRGVVGLVVAAVALAAAVSLLDTTERPASFPPPGYHVTEMAVPGRAVPVRLHLWYPTESDAATVLVGQNRLFYGEHVSALAVAGLCLALGANVLLMLTLRAKRDSEAATDASLAPAVDAIAP